MADPPSYPGTPRWAKVSWIIAAVVILLFVIVLLTRGPHGPGRHGDGGGGQTPSSSVTGQISPADISNHEG